MTPQKLAGVFQEKSYRTDNSYSIILIDELLPSNTVYCVSEQRNDAGLVRSRGSSSTPPRTVLLPLGPAGAPRQGRP